MKRHLCFLGLAALALAPAAAPGRRGATGGRPRQLPELQRRALRRTLGHAPHGGRSALDGRELGPREPQFEGQQGLAGNLSRRPNHCGGRRAQGQGILHQQRRQDLRRPDAYRPRPAGRPPLRLLLLQPGRPRAVPQDRGLYRQPVRRGHLRRPVHLQLPLRPVSEGQGRVELDRLPPESHERGGRESRRQERQGRQSQGQPDHQAAQLVRAVPVLGLQPRSAAARLRHDLLRHRDAGRGKHGHAPPALPELQHHALSTSTSSPASSAAAGSIRASGRR